MKNIELTEEHKVKLLEMCEKLFPEYDFTLDKWKQCFVTFGLKSEELYKEHIHWFEFCMTSLINRLASKNIKTDILADCEFEDFRMKCVTEIFRDKISKDYIHPVDYLYKEFKEVQ